MSCPTCDHTVELFGVCQKVQIFWCKRCGTIIEIEEDRVQTPHVPALVERCREFARRIPTAIVGPAWNSEWNRLGIREAINKPEGRPR